MAAAVELFTILVPERGMRPHKLFAFTTPDASLYQEYLSANSDFCQMSRSFKSHFNHNCSGVADGFKLFLIILAAIYSLFVLVVSLVCAWEVVQYTRSRNDGGAWRRELMVMAVLFTALSVLFFVVGFVMLVPGSVAYLLVRGWKRMHPRTTVLGFDRQEGTVFGVKWDSGEKLQKWPGARR